MWKIILTILYWILLLVIAWKLISYLNKKVSSNFLHLFNFVLFITPIYVFGYYLSYLNILNFMTYLICGIIGMLFMVIRGILNKDMSDIFSYFLIFIPAYLLIIMFLIKFTSLWIAMVITIILLVTFIWYILTFEIKKIIKIVSYIILILGIITFIGGYYQDILNYFYNPNLIILSKISFSYIVFILFIAIIFYQVRLSDDYEKRLGALEKKKK